MPTLEQTLSNKRRSSLAGMFLPVVEFPTVGGQVYGRYISTQKETIQGKAMTTHTIALIQWENVTYKSGGAPYEPKAGEKISASGAVLDRAFTDLAENTEIVITFRGLGAKKGTQSPCKLFDVEQVEA